MTIFIAHILLNYRGISRTLQCFAKNLSAPRRKCPWGAPYCVIAFGFGFLRRSRSLFQTRLSAFVPDTALTPPSLEAYRLLPCNRTTYILVGVAKGMAIASALASCVPRSKSFRVTLPPPHCSFASCDRSISASMHVSLESYKRCLVWHTEIFRLFLFNCSFQV